MKKEMYYVREKRTVKGKDGKKSKGLHRIGAVTVIQDEAGKYHRGIAILSDKDGFDRQEAVARSNDRAVHAMLGKLSELPISLKKHAGKQAVRRFIKALNKSKMHLPDSFKVSYNTKLSKFEKRMFEGKKGELA